MIARTSVRIAIAVVVSFLALAITKSYAQEGVNFGEGMPPVAEQAQPESTEMVASQPEAEPAPATESTSQTTTSAITTDKPAPTQSQEQTVKFIVIGGERIACAGGRVVDERYAPRGARSAGHRHATRPESWYRDMSQYRNGETAPQRMQWDLFRQNKREHAAFGSAISDLYGRSNRGLWGLLGLLGLLGGLAAFFVCRRATFPGPAPYQSS